MPGIELMRLILDNLNRCREDFYPDQWTPRQVQEALAGKAPRWDDAERHVYG